MSSTDPFNIVKDELKRTVKNTHSLIENLKGLRSSENENSPKLLTEIKTNLKSISWDIQDLQETINIASQNPAKFNLSNSELQSRKEFINQTKEFVLQTKELFNIDLDDAANTSASISNSKASQSQLKNNTLSNVNIRVPDIISNATRQGDYSRLNDNDESDYEIDIARIRNQNVGKNTVNNSFRKTEDDSSNYHAIQMQHEQLFREQDKNLDMLSTGVSNLKNISQTMQMELDDQANLLNDLGREMDVADGRMQQTMKKITKLLHMDNDGRQWTVIGILIAAIIVVLILFAIL